jgi:hypothetical protein
MKKTIDFYINIINFSTVITLKLIILNKASELIYVNYIRIYKQLLIKDMI